MTLEQVSYLQDDNDQIGDAITEMPTKNEFVILGFRLKSDVLLSNKSEDHRKNEHECLQEDDGKITFWACNGTQIDGKKRQR